jgi:hypothetical protein
MVLFHMLTGRCPYRGTVKSILEHIKHFEGPKFVTSDENVSEGSRTLVLNMVSPEIKDRLRAMELVAEELRTLLKTVKGRKGGPPGPRFDDDAPSMEGIALPPKE